MQDAMAGIRLLAPDPALQATSSDAHVPPSVDRFRARLAHRYQPAPQFFRPTGPELVRQGITKDALATHSVRLTLYHHAQTILVKALTDFVARKELLLAVPVLNKEHISHGC